MKQAGFRKIPYARVVCDGRELEYVRQVLESGWLTTAGRALEFEKHFAAAVGTRHACAVNSCTAALHLALESLGVGPGAKVFVPTMTFTATAEVVRYLGADPVFLDVDYGTALLTPEIVASAIRRHPDVKVLTVVHFGGQPAAMTKSGGEGLLDLCHRQGIRVVEDAAHAFPARRDGRMIGSFGDVTCFSFYANKTITTGEGGMLTTADEALYRRCKVMRLHGIDRDVWNRFTSDKPSWEYDVIAPGYKYNMPDVNAAIGLAQLERAEALRQGRERCARAYYDALAECPHLDLPTLEVPFADHAWHLFPVVLRDAAPLSRNQFIEELARRGVGTSVHYKPVHRLRYYAERYGLRPEDFPNAERLWRGCVSLPIYPSLTVDETTYVAEAIREVLSGHPEKTNARAVNTHELPVGEPVETVHRLVQPAQRHEQRVRLSVPHASGREMAYIQAAFESNWLSTVGPNIDALEARFNERLERSSLAVGCGTSAIHLGLRLLGVQAGDEVVAPSLTFVASTNPVLYLGARPVFLDSERCSWNLDPQLLGDFLKRRAEAGRLPRAVIAVHLFGQPADMDPIVELCRQYEVGLLEDAAEALGATYKGRPVGIFGKVAAFSFNGNKVITSTGGGVLTASQPDWIQRARHWSTQACDPDPTGAHEYVHSQLGYNYRLSNVLAGIALGQLEVLEERVAQRRAVFARYQQAFQDLPGSEAQPEASFGDQPSAIIAQPSGFGIQNSALEIRSSLHTRWLSCFLIDETQFGMSAADLIRYLDAANVESRPVWKPMHTQPLYRGYECVGGAVAEDLNRRGICLPSSSSLSQEDQQFVIDRVREAHFAAMSRRRDKVIFSATTETGSHE